MKKIYLLSFLLLFALTSKNSFAQGGGPDAFGYTWLGSTDAGGPTYNWVDISSSGTPITGLTDDNLTGTINIGWNFHYYWSDYNQVKIGSNGWVRFGTASTNIASCFPLMPTAGGTAGNNFLGVLLSDLIFSGAGNYGAAYYYSNNVDSFVVTWDSVPAWVDATPDFTGWRTFQVILNGADSSIRFQYKSTDGTFVDNTACPADIEVGIENLTGNIGLEVFNETLPPNNYAVVFDYPAVPLITIPDATPEWAANADNAGQFFQLGTPVSLTASASNVGNGDITTDITVSATVKDLPLNIVYPTTNQTIAGGLTVGSSQTVTFSPQFIATTPGQYYYEVNTTNSQDINPSNNVTQVEVSVPGTNANGELVLTYCTGNPPDGSLAWSGGNAGVGVKMVPPGNPCIVNSVEVFITGDDGDTTTPMLAGFDIEIWNDNAGVPGTMLQTVTVDINDISEDNWNTVVFDTPVNIAAGEPFYLAWMMNGVSVGIGTEAFGPISRRSYEILSGSWAVYRENSANEFLIKANLDSAIISGVQTPITGIFNLDLFPNPGSEMVTVSWENENSSNVSLTLVNMYGQSVFNRRVSGVFGRTNEVEINTFELASGVYFLNLETATGKMSKKLVVAH